jgi:hypothetical protein
MRMSPEDRPSATTTADVPRKNPKPGHETWCSIIKSSIFSNIVKSYPITPLIMWQVKDHVCPTLVRRVPTVSVLLGALFQECVNNCTVYMVMLQNTTIINHKTRMNILESGGLTESDKLVVYKASWIASSFSKTSMIFLYVLVTKLRTNVSLSIGTPIPTKLSKQKESRAMSALRCVNAELAGMMQCAASNTVCCVQPLVGRMSVFATLSSRPGSSRRKVSP